MPRHGEALSSGHRANNRLCNRLGRFGTYLFLQSSCSGICTHRAGRKGCATDPSSPLNDAPVRCQKRHTFSSSGRSSSPSLALILLRTYPSFCLDTDTQPAWPCGHRAVFQPSTSLRRACETGCKRRIRASGLNAADSRPGNPIVHAFGAF